MGRWLMNAIEWIGGHELIVLVGLLITAAGTWAFLELADQVLAGRTKHFDDKILRALRRPDDPTVPIGPPWMTDAARDITALGSVTVIILITGAVAGYLLLDEKYAATLFVLASTGSGFGLGVLLKSAFRRPRPDVVPHLVPAHYYSFPSGHSLMSAVAYLTLGALLAQMVARRRLKFYFLTLAVTVTGLVGISRVYLGVHYPSDVLAGWCAGLSWASLCWMVGRHLQRQGAIEREG
jgi:undecaprenyl-diphosphatase